MIKLFRLIPFLLLISGICFYPFSNTFASENDQIEPELDIELSTKENLFDISGMKPGDWAPRTITVQNSGSKDFVYQMKVQNSGEKKLFNELMVEIKAGDTELYKGKMAALESLPERKLASNAEEKLDVTIRFPEHLGNDFQGLTAAFVFSFTAEGKENTAVVMTKGQIASSSFGPTSSGFSLPTISTNILTLMLLGALLVVGRILLIILRHRVRHN